MTNKIHLSIKKDKQRMLITTGVYLEWKDAASSDDWTSYDDAKDETALHLCQALGLLFYENDEHIVITLLNDIHGEAIADYIAIPKANITYRVNLTIPEKEKKPNLNLI
jgi:hypothetical protein